MTHKQARKTVQDVIATDTALVTANPTGTDIAAVAYAVWLSEEHGTRPLSAPIDPGILASFYLYQWLCLDSVERFDATLVYQTEPTY